MFHEFLLCDSTSSIEAFQLQEPTHSNQNKLRTAVGFARSKSFFSKPPLVIIMHLVTSDQTDKVDVVCNFELCIHHYPPSFRHWYVFDQSIISPSWKLSKYINTFSAPWPFKGLWHLFIYFFFDCFLKMLQRVSF